jgi:hypothetical protein
MAGGRMNRRRLIAGGLGAAALAHAQGAAATKLCTPASAAKPASCWVGSHVEWTPFFQKAKSNDASWCWAACLSMAFARQGYTIGQEQIVQQTWGDIQRMPESTDKILADLSREWVDEKQRRFVVSSQVESGGLATTPKTLLESALDQNVPILLGCFGHCTLLVELSYIIGPGGAPQIEDATLIDPWPYTTFVQELSPSQLSLGSQFVARIQMHAA